MEYIPGETLEDKIKNGVNVEESLRYFEEAVEALDYLHNANGLSKAHRDVKPENIIIDEEGRLRILDLGSVTDKVGKTFGTTLKTFKGTVKYAHTEQITGNASAATDLYSLGLVLYELVCGEIKKSEFGKTHEAVDYDEFRSKIGGERVNAPFVAAYLKHLGIDAKYVSALDHLYERNGTVDFVGTLKSGVNVTEGFIYRKDDGSIGTFPTGGSEVSGDIIAEGLKAELYGVIKNNPWFCTTDPKIVQGALRVGRLTYRELAELAYAGARAMNERGMILSSKSGRPILIGSAQDFMEHATRVCEERDDELVEKPYAGIASKDGFIIYRLVADNRNLLPVF